MECSAVNAVIKESAATLAAAWIRRARWEAEQIVSSVMGCEPITLIVDPPELLPAEREEVQRKVQLRAGGVPLQHLTGIAGFCGHDLVVGPEALIPRPETERLVEVALRELGQLAVRRPTVVDVGTGSGAIAISLTAAFSVGTMLGLDLSDRALAVARENAVRLAAATDMRWLQSDLLTACAPGSIDLIVANLPYIPSSAIPLLPPEVQRDPVMAVDGGSDGLAVIRRLMNQAPDRLRPHGVVALEVGAGQAGQLQREYATDWVECDIVLDDTGTERVIVLRRAKRGVPHGG